MAMPDIRQRGPYPLNVFEGEPKLNPRFLALRERLAPAAPCLGNHRDAQGDGTSWCATISTAHFSGQPAR